MSDRTVVRRIVWAVFIFGFAVIFQVGQPTARDRRTDDDPMHRSVRILPARTIIRMPADDGKTVSEPKRSTERRIQPAVVPWVNRAVDRLPLLQHGTHRHTLYLSDAVGDFHVWDVLKDAWTETTVIGGVLFQEGTYGTQVVSSMLKTSQAEFCAQTGTVKYEMSGAGGRRLLYHDTDQTLLLVARNGMVTLPVDWWSCNPTTSSSIAIGYWSLIEGGGEYRSWAFSHQGASDLLARFDLLGNLLGARILNGDHGDGLGRAPRRQFMARFGDTIAMVTSVSEFFLLLPPGGYAQRWVSRLTGDVLTTPPASNPLLAVLWKINALDLSLMATPYYVKHPEVNTGSSYAQIIGIPTHDGGFVVAMVNRTGDALIVVRIDANMQKVWEKRFTAPYRVSLGDTEGRMVEIRDAQGNTTGYMLTFQYFIDPNTPRLVYFYLDAATGNVIFVRETPAGFNTATALVANVQGKIFLGGDPGPGGDLPASVALWEGMYDATTGAYEGAYVRSRWSDPHLFLRHNYVVAGGPVLPTDTIAIREGMSITQATAGGNRALMTFMDQVLPPLQFFGKYQPVHGIPFRVATFDPNAPEPLQSTTSVTVTDTNDVIIAPLPAYGYGYTPPGTTQTWTLPGGQTLSFTALPLTFQDEAAVSVLPHRTVAPTFLTTNDFIEYGVVPIGRQVTQTVTITRVLDDAYTLTIGWLPWSGDTTQFQFTHNCDTTQQGQTCDITITYIPTTVGSHYARLFIYADPLPGAIYQYIELSGTAVPGRTLTVTKNGTGSGRVTSDPAGIDCGPTCSNAFAEGDTVILTAYPALDSVLTQWGGDCAACGNSVTCAVTMDVDRTCTVTFDLFDQSRAAERYGQTDTLVADLLEQNLTMTDGTVTGALNGTFTWTALQTVTIDGNVEFAGQGFASGTWTATLDTITYTGTWSGVVYPEGQSIRVRGVTQGDIVGILQGTVTDVNGTQTFSGAWEIKRLGAQFRTAELQVSGTLNLTGSQLYTGVTFYVLQSNMTGSVTGDYQTDVDLTLTHVRVQDATNPYDGRGFLRASYSSADGQGMLWTDAVAQGNGQTELTGFATRPLRGIATGTLD